MKGQVSVFMIMGLILLIAAAVLIFIDSADEKQELLPGVFVSIKDVPTELDPISTFVTQCLEDTGARALRLVGEHGGYVDIDDPEITGNSFRITSSPTESDAVVFAPGGSLKIPYWFYLESPNTCEGNCVFTSNRPPLRDSEDSIEKQLNRFIEREINNCLNDFESLEEFKITQLSDLSVNTKIAEQDVVIILDYELEVNRGDVSSEIDQFFVRIPLNLQKIYNLATEITNLQQEHRFIERQTMNLISSFSAVDESKLPPIADMRFEFGSTTSWIKSDVKKKVSQILTSYIPLFKVDASQNYNREFYSSNLQQRLYDSMIVPITDVQYNDLDVTFNYLDFWPIFFDLNCDGENCQPESASSNILSFIGLQRYNFVYDISFPTLVEIQDESAFNNRGYKFNIFLEANVRNNQQLETNFVPLESVRLSRSSFLCNPGNRNSADITITAFDSVSSEPLEDVSVALSVAGDSCFIGSTNENGSLVTKFPTGTIGAVVNLIKPDYIAKSQLFDAREEALIEMKLDPITDKKVIIKKKLLEKANGAWTFTNRIVDLRPAEEAVVTLTRLSPLTEEDFNSFVSVQGPNEQELRIAPGEYEVSINLFLREDITIPEKTKKVKTGLFSEKKFTIPGFEFSKDNPYPSGGLKLNVTITQEDLNQDTIVFFAIAQAIYEVPENERAVEDLEQSAKTEEYSTLFAALLRPIFQ